MGYNGWFGPPHGNPEINFITGTPLISYLQLEMEFRHTHANISDDQGNLLFYTNGYYIADATHDTMQNGSGINPGAYANYVPDGFLIPQGALIIPKPCSSSVFYMFHNTLDNHPSPGAYSKYFYLTIIDMTLNGGLGAVTVKNHILISDSMNTGKITACKHANGRDWWVICHQLNTSRYFKLLVTPYGLPTVTTQDIGLTRWMDAGQAKFSPDGKKFAYYHYFDGLDIFDFDRCTGDFSNPTSDTTLPYIQGNVGLEFSPNSELLYIMNITEIYQYNLIDTNILASKQIVATYDNFFQPGIPNLGVYLCYPQLAPDGKIYFTSGNGTTYLGVINYPDSLGTACDVAQHSVLLPAYYFNTIPNHPNYFLGADSGSVCDTIVTTVNVFEPTEIKIKTFPNPNNGIFTLGFPAQKEQGVLEIYDVLGNLILKENVAQWSQYKRINISGANTGIYLCKISWGERSANVKVMKE